MFKNTYQNGLLSIFYSCGSNPLTIWDSEVNNGHIKRLTDNEVKSIVLEIVSTNVATTFITCPRNNQVLGIKLPFLVIIVKNLKRYFSFEITILDDRNMRRRFRISNFQSTTKIKPFCTSMPIGLSGGWNQVQFNLADFTRRAYGSQFLETLRVQVHANCRLRRIYFSDRLYTEDELPQDYKLYLPLEHKKKTKPEIIKKSTVDIAPKAAKKPPTDAPPPAEPAKEEQPQSAKEAPAAAEPNVSPIPEGSPAGDATPVEAEVKAESAEKPPEIEAETPVESAAETPREEPGAEPDAEPDAEPGEQPGAEPGAEPDAEPGADLAEAETPVDTPTPAESPAPDTPVDEAPTE